MEMCEFFFTGPLLLEEVWEMLPYDAARLVHEAESERRYLEEALLPEEFLTARERRYLGILEREREDYLEKRMEAEASFSERHMRKYLRRAGERKRDYIESMINMEYNPYPELFVGMPSQEEIEETQRYEFAYKAWQYSTGTAWETDTPGDMYMKLFGEAVH
jgi:hypothetical protein